MSETMSSMMDAMSSSMMDMSSMASSTMDMMDMASSTMDMSLETGMDMDMSMHMSFTTDYKDYPVLFSSLSAKNGGEAFGIFVLLFFIGFITKFFDFAKGYLEQRVWNRDSLSPVLESSSEDEKDHTVATPTKPNFTSRLIKDFIRLVLIFVPEMFGFALMLAAMTFSLVYFFAVVCGLSFGRLFFEKLGRKYRLSPGEDSSHHG